MSHLNVFDDKVPFAIRDNLWNYCINSTYRLGWEDTDVPEKYDNPDNLKEIVYTSLFIPGRIILFDGSIPHAIRPQSVKAPKFRFTLSLFFD